MVAASRHLPQACQLFASPVDSDHGRRKGCPACELAPLVSAILSPAALRVNFPPNACGLTTRTSQHLALPVGTAHRHSNTLLCPWFLSTGKQEKWHACGIESRTGNLFSVSHSLVTGISVSSSLVHPAHCRTGVSSFSFACGLRPQAKQIVAMPAASVHGQSNMMRRPWSQATGG